MTSAEFAAEGWYPVDPSYPQYYPPRDRIVEFARDERVYRQPPFFANYGDLPPEFNIYGLWWREA